MGGGGQPRSKDREIVKKRQQALYGCGEGWRMRLAVLMLACVCMCACWSGFAGLVLLVWFAGLVLLVWFCLHGQGVARRGE